MTSALEQIAEVLDRHGVEYLIIGGQAEALFGSPRVTYDVDVCYRRTQDNIARLSGALLELRAELRGAPPGLPFRPDPQTLAAGCNFTLKTSVVDLDVLGEVEPLGGFDALLSRAETYSVFGRRLRTIGLEDLIRAKEHIKRARDSDSLAQLRAIRLVRARQSGAPDAPPPHPA